MLDVFVESAIIAINGSIMALLGNFLYSTNDYSFVSRDGFQSKDKATVILLLAFLFTALLSVGIDIVVRHFVNTFSLLSTIGVLIIVLRLTVNILVRNWNPFDDKSIQLYAVGVLIFIAGYYFRP
jgi:hypothetical protein